MRPEHCVTRNHIDLWNNSVLPSKAVRVRLRTVLRGSLLPLAAWLGVAGLGYASAGPVAAVAVGGLFLLFVLTGFGLRRRARHSVRCSLYGALGGVLDKSLGGL